MGSINKFISNSVGKAFDSIQSFGDKFSSTISKVHGYVGTAFEVAKNGETFVGINYAEVPNIRAAIKQYVTNVQNELNKLNTDASSANALKGEDVTAAVQAYIKAVDDVSKAFVSALLAYSDKMYEYADQKAGAMSKHQASLATDVSDEATALASTAEVYTEKY